MASNAKALAITLKLVDKMTAPLKKIMGGFDGLQQKIDQTRKRTQRFQRQLDSSLQRSANLSISGAGMVAFGRKMSDALRGPTDVAAEFEATMSKVQALTRLDITKSGQKQQFEALRRQALELGKTTSFSASEAADAQSFLAMAGFTPDKITAAMPGMLSLAKAGGTELARTADIASNILSGFSLKASEMGRVGDVLSYTFTKSNVNLEMLGETMKYVAPVAAAAGASIEEVAAMTGTMGDVGLQGSMAGTALRSAFLRLADSPKPVTQALRKLGVDALDSTGKFRPMLDILRDLHNSLKNYENGDRIAEISSIFGAEAAAGMTELVVNIDKLESKFSDIKREANGTSQKIADIMGNNTAGKIKEMKSAFEGLQITVGDLLLPTYNKSIETVTRIIRVTQTFIERNKQLTQNIIAFASKAAAGITTLGGLAIGIASLLTPLALLRYGLQHVALRLTTARLIFLGIGSAVVVVLRQWQELLPTINQYFPALGDWLGNRLPAQMQRFQQAGEYLRSYIRSLKGDLEQTTNTAAPALFKQSPQWLQQIKQLRSGLQQAQLQSSPVDHFRTVEKGDTLWSIAKDFHGAGQEYQRVAQRNQDIIKNADRIMPGQQINLGQRKRLPDSVISPVPNIQQSALPRQIERPTSLSVTPEQIVQQSTALATLRHASKIAFDVDIVDKYGDAISWLHTVTQTALERLQAPLGRFQSSSINALRSVIEWVGENASTIGGAFGLIGGGILSSVVVWPKRLASSVTWLAGIWKDALKNMQGGLPELQKKVKTVLSAVNHWFNQNAGKIRDVFVGVATRALERLGKTLDWLSKKATDGSIGRWLDQMLQRLGPILDGITAFGRGIVNAAFGIGKFLGWMSQLVGGWENMGKIFLALSLISVFSGLLGGLAALATIIASVGSLLIWLSSLLGLAKLASTAFSNKAGMGKKALSILGKAAKFAGKAIVWLGRALMLNPIGLIITAIAAGAYLIYKNWGSLVNWWNNSTLKQHTTQVSTAAVSYAAQKWQQFTSWWNNSTLMEKATGILTAPITAAKVLANDFFQWWLTTEMGQKAAKIGTAAIDYARQKMQSFLEWWNSLSLKNIATSVTTNVTKKVSEVGSSISNAASSAMNYITGKRATGGPVQAGGFYRVNELGPELLTMKGATYLMASHAGNVTPLISKFSTQTQQAANDNLNNRQQTQGNLALAEEPQFSVHKRPSQTAKPLSLGNIQITINPSSGMDEAALAEMVEIRLRDLMHELNNNDHALYDTE